MGMSVAVAQAGPRDAGWVSDIDGLHAALDALTSRRAVDEWFGDDEVRAMASSLGRAKARLDAIMVVLARDLHERDAARAVGAVNTGQLLAQDFGGDRQDANALVRTAIHLSNTPKVEKALAVGRIDRTQAGIIARAMNHLPVAVDTADRERAEESLMAARLLSVKDLSRAATRAADAFTQRADADAHEEQQLRTRERRARRETTWWMRDNHDGTHRGGFVLPDAEAETLRTAVEALSAPRRYHLSDADWISPPDAGTAHPTGSAKAATNGDGAAEAGESMNAGDGGRNWLPTDRRHREGRAFATLCSHLPADALPNAGGISAVLTVNVDYDVVTEQLGPGTLPSGTRISASKTRELACAAGIVPQVLGGKALPLDLGQMQRFFTATQRRALAHRDGGCAYPGCARPPQWCEGHHWRDAWKPRRLGGPHGPTGIANGCLLCAYHHRLVHERNTQIREHDGHLEFLIPPLTGLKTTADYGGDLFTPQNPTGDLQWQRNYRWSAGD